MDTCKPPFPCNDESRVAELDKSSFASPHNGIEAIEVDSTLPQPRLTVYFFGNMSATLQAAVNTDFVISGGVRVPGPTIHVTAVAVNASDSLLLTLDQFGDFSDYYLTINGHSADLDPIYNCCRFSFTVDCDNPFDCRPPTPPPASLPPGPPIDYQAKDYQSFRRALLGFLPSRLPGFAESNEADLTVTLAELFAYAGDQLSYFQDAVATESTLSTVRQRRSAKRHARLVDYRMHDGLAARTVLFFKLAKSVPSLTINKGLLVTTDDIVESRKIPFETDATIQCFVEHNRIKIHTWLNSECCLLRGATSADLEGPLPNLLPGSLLLFEEIRGEVLREDGTPLKDANGIPVLVAEAANPARRQIVRIRDVVPVTDDLRPLTDPLMPAGQQAITRVFWEEEDALRFDFCLRSDANGKPATVARANLVPASHGRTIFNEIIDRDSTTLSKGPLTWLEPVPDNIPALLYPPDVPNPNRALSSIRLQVNGETWSERESFLDASEDSAYFVVDTENDGRGTLRFGDGRLGKALPDGAIIAADYRVGNGTSGNVGADVLTTPLPPGVERVRNPLPATGGIDPQPIIDVQRDAPQEFRNRQYRAVTEQDYAEAAKGVAGVANAVATFRWTGSWLTVFVAVDPEGRDALQPALSQLVMARLDSYRQAGYDLEIQPPTYVPLKIELEICVAFDYFQADVQKAVLDVLSSGIRVNGAKGFFHPDQFTFGDSLYLSRLYAAVQDVEGVRSVHATTFQKLNYATGTEIQDGFIAVGDFEIVRVDNDSSEPDNGFFILTMIGGK